MNKNKRFVDLLLMGSGRVGQAVFSFLCVTLIARSMEVEELGLYSMFLAVFGYASICCDFGFRTTIIRDWNLPRANKNKLISNKFITYNSLIIN